jgi:subtilase family serine protease
MKTTNKGTTQSVFESLGQSFSPADLSTFQTLFGVPQVPIAQVIGPNSPSDCTANPNNCVEANLDVQFITSIAQYAATTFWSVDSSSDGINLFESLF